MRVLFALAGLNRVERGAEIAFKAIGSELALMGHEVTLIGSGAKVGEQPYEYLQVPSARRERFERLPKVPMLRNEAAWEDLSFALSLLRAYDPRAYDVTITCAFPFSHWALRAGWRRHRPPHVFVTQNGDWPAWSDAGEFRWFACDGLVCTNPNYFDRNSARYRAALIPNGVDLRRFSPGLPAPARFTDSAARPIVLMVSALIASKHVEAGIRAVALLPGAQLIVAGDGPLRHELQELGAALLPGRYLQTLVESGDMPTLYRSADVLIHLSEDESFGNVYIEALACGTAVVARDTPHTRWVLGDTGFFSRSLDPQDIADQLVRGIEGASRTRQEGVARAAGFAWPKIAAAYSEFLKNVVAGADKL